MSARILVVDDVPTNAKLLEARLIAEYFEVNIAYDGHDALKQAEMLEPDIILLDVMMPGLDGFEVCRRLKADQKTRHIPVLAVTAFAMKGDEKRIREGGCEAYISKPISVTGFMGTIRSLLNEEDGQKTSG